MSSGSRMRRLIWPASRLKKRVLPFGIAALCIFAVVHRLDDISIADVARSVGSVTVGQWLTALFATSLSFAAVGQYDALFHRWLRTGVTARRALVSGAGAIALAQTLGMGLATGTLARWRMLPEISVPTALKVTNYVSFSFMAGLGLLATLLLALPGNGELGATDWSLCTIVLVILALALSILRPRWLPVRLPPWRMGARLMGLITLDIAAAAIALWVFLPAEMAIAFPFLLTVFTLSIGAGLLSGTPGGVGPFELCLISLLPTVPEPELLAAILSFRLVYYALPACIGLVLLARPTLPAATGNAPFPFPPSSAFKRAEALLSDQPEHRLVPASDATCLHVAEASQTLVAIGDSVTGGCLTHSSFIALERAASDGSRWPAFYKCSAATAGLARQRGWTVVPISEEAWIDPKAYTLETPARRQLRRKLKSASRSGVTIVQTQELPVDAMTLVAEDWASRMGGERGFSMGRFCPEHLSKQRNYLAYADGQLVAFASFHTVNDEWALDLMRSLSEMPNGTMHALIHAAIEDARACCVPRLSLAAMARDDTRGLVSSLLTSGNAQGLRRFKQCFMPRTQRLYAAAPNPVLMLLAGVDIWLRIKAPTRKPALRATCSMGRPARASRVNRGPTWS